MSTKISTGVILFLTTLSFILGFYLLPQLPEQFASHWNTAGEVDGYMSKFWGVFLMPMVALGMLLVFLVIPKIDPLKKNIEAFRKQYNVLVTLIIAFLLYIYVLSLAWNLGYRFDMTRFIIPSIGLLFIFIGSILKYAKRNWFVGIRTPWTLSSDTVWDKTHKLGGKLFQWAGAIAVVGLLFPQYIIWFIVVPIISVSLFTIVYSYFEYNKELKTNE